MAQVFDTKRLEYDKILEKLSALCYSQHAKETALQLQPTCEIEEIEQRLDETEGAVYVFLRRGEPSLQGLSDIGSYISRAERDATLSCAELLELARVLRCFSRLLDYSEHVELQLKNEREEEYGEKDGKTVSEDAERRLLPKGETLAAVQLCDAYLKHFREIGDFRDLRRAIEQAVLSEEELADHASPELASLRRRIKEQQVHIRSRLEQILKNDADLLTDSIYTQRNGRFVIPVKASERGRIQGLVHDASASGQTVFIEPLAVLEANNKIRELKIEEAKEVERILFRFSQWVKSTGRALRRSSLAAVHLDFIQGRARLALQMKAVRPRLNEDGRLLLKKARHPLIEEKKVVPIDLELGRRFSTLLITGPNTGGKTVALKTCGLLTLMGMSGLMIPAADHSELSVFHKVLADIGDEQSIEQSLSTFSSHMRHIIQILELADSQSLILVDELGSGTDPSEGAALAMAILEELRRREAKTLASTHYRELKMYAMENVGVENACCEFDLESLRPTYKLLIGLPGVSNALLISRRLGLPESLVTRAKEFLDRDAQHFEEVLAEAETERRKWEESRGESERIRKELEKSRAEFEEERLLRKEKEEAKQASLREEYRSMFREKLKITELLLEDIQKARREGRIGDAGQLAFDLRSSLRSEIREQEAVMAASALRSRGEKKRKDDTLILRAGENYYVPLLGKNAKLLEEVKGKKQVLVQAGNFQTRVDPHSLERARDEAPRASAARSAAVSGSAKEERRLRSEAGRSSFERSLHFSPELKLLGLRVDEAEVELDHFLDHACLSSVKQLRIVHGKGTGALRSMVLHKLKKDARVKSCAAAPFGQGDAGVTVVELK